MQTRIHGARKINGILAIVCEGHVLESWTNYLLMQAKITFVAKALTTLNKAILVSSVK